MKFELKTENENYSKSISYFLGLVFIFSLIIILGDIALKLGIISRHYQIEFNCKMLTVKKSSFNIKKLSRLTNLKKQQRILEFCREYVK